MRDVTNIISSQIREAIIAIRVFHPTLPFKLLYLFSKYACLDTHAKDFEDARLNLCKELCEKHDKGSGGDGTPKMVPILNDKKEIVKNQETGEPLTKFVFTEENQQKLNEEYEKLSNELVEIPDYRISAEEIKVDLHSDKIPNLHIFMEYMVRD